MKTKVVQTRLVKPTETAELNSEILLLPRLIAGIPAWDYPDPGNVVFSEENSEIYGTSCCSSVLIPSISVDFRGPFHIEGYFLSQDTWGGPRPYRKGYDRLW